MRITANAYRLVNAGTIFLAVIGAVLLAVLKDQEANSLAAGILVTVAVLDVLSIAYIARTAWTSRKSKKPGGRLLEFLLSDAALVTAGVAGIAFVIVRAFLGFPPLDGQSGRLIVGGGAILASIVPVRKALLFFLVSREPRTADVL